MWLAGWLAGLAGWLGWLGWLGWPWAGLGWLAGWLATFLLMDKMPYGGRRSEKKLPLQPWPGSDM